MPKTILNPNLEALEKAYENPESVPWYDTTIPRELRDLVETKQVAPCRVLDIGCGNGFHAMYLAQHGFDVLGIDVSTKAIAYAKKHAARDEAKLKFKVMDAEHLDKLQEQFDLIIEWGVLHFIPFAKRKSHIKTIARRLNTNGIYVSLSFDVEGKEWGGGKIRIGTTGSTIYYSSIEELRELVAPYFKILETKKRLTVFEQSGQTHIHNYLLLRKK